MGLLDNLRDRLTGHYDDGYEDDYYDDYDDEGGDYQEDYNESRGTGILGNTSRPEAESVAVYTRSGRPVASNAGAPAQGSQARGGSSASYSSYRGRRDDFEDGFDDYAPSGTFTPAGPLNASGQLPPYSLRCETYEDVQTVVRRVRTNQPVLLQLQDTDPETAQRIIDFCYGLAFGIGGKMLPVEGKAFVVVPEGINLSQADLERLASQVR